MNNFKLKFFKFIFILTSKSDFFLFTKLLYLSKNSFSNPKTHTVRMDLSAQQPPRWKSWVFSHFQHFDFFFFCKWRLFIFYLLISISLDIKNRWACSLVQANEISFVSRHIPELKMSLESASCNRLANFIAQRVTYGNTHH